MLLRLVEDSIELDGELKIVGGAAAKRVARFQLVGSLLSERKSATKVHSREPQLVPRRGVGRVVEDPRVVLERSLDYPGRADLGVKVGEDVGAVKRDPVGANPGAVAVLGTIEESPVEMADDATRVVGYPRLVQRVTQRSRKVFIGEVATQQRISTSVVTETFPHSRNHRLKVARLE